MRSLFCAVSLFALVSVAAPATDSLAVTAPKLESPLWALVVDARDGVEGRVLVNGLAAADLDGSETNGMVAMQLRPGKNTLTIDVTAAPAGKGEPAIEIALHAAERGTFPEPENRAFQLKVPWKDLKKGTRTWTFELAPAWAPSPKLWSDADVFKKLTPEDEKAIRALVEQRLKAFQAGDTARIEELGGFLLSELARLAHVDPATLKMDSRPEAQKKMKETWAAATVPEKLEFALQGEGRVVVVTANGGQPPLVAKTPSGGTARLPTKCVRLKGVWTLLQ